METARSLTEEWKRSEPDIQVYLPKQDIYTGDNEHFLVFQSPKGEWLALWTQSSVEGHGDNHLVLARSRDQLNWSEPAYLIGSKPGEKGKQASWGFPVVADSGRIYIFYTKDIGIYDVDSQTTGTMGCIYSDDDGFSWTASEADIPMPRNRYDHPDPHVPRSWIAWQKPIRDSKGRWLTGYTQWSSLATYAGPPAGWYSKDSRSLFMRFENIDEGPDPSQLAITWLPEVGDGLEVPYPGQPELSVAQEPSLALLPDGRLFCVMRTYTGCIWYSLSADDGATWTKPEPLLYEDGGEPVKQPIASCPLYPLADGRFVLVFHNNDGHIGPYGPQHALYNRRPAYLSAGTYAPQSRQPIRFAPPKQFADTDGLTIGPKGTNEIATYPSLTEWEGRTVLWYPDRKYYLLGKYITEKWL
ncbi:BNR repeat-like domain-containing protein [Paenibacillus sp. UNCCL117]|uniref:sialidase family protein n=1 Tax=unclassified Paenibacillus TaxID=185978 RepID=UPI0008865B44|nr:MULTISPECIES: sialidase family protein [unclassified Paenibacillus]SDE45830.1 BNR repeat-like domain-containing protein [Paenibacillus sp. cl123]SFW65985.1 BNR repeat-like domain-containing protein [Paenibacillus sp. UNCCL117]